MTRAEWIQTKRRRYLANILSDFERNVEPHLRASRDAASAVEAFKGLVRAKLNALAVDAIGVIQLGDGDEVAINAAAEDLKDRLGVRPTTRSM